MTTTTTVPGVHAVGVNGTGFLVDDREGRGVKRRSVPFLRNQADTGSKPGAQSLSPAGVWRSYAEDWSHGAGQSNRDREDSDPARFRSSKGANVWDRWKLSLLADTALSYAMTGTGAGLLTSNNYVYVVNYNEVYYTSNPTPPATWGAASIHAGEAAAIVAGIASDDRYVYAALGANGIHRHEPPGPATHYNDLQAQTIAYVKGRLMASVGPSLYNVTASGAAPAALYTHSNSKWTWTAYAGGGTHIYAAGLVTGGQLSAVYKTAIQPDGTSLAVPSIALEMPPGELIYGLGAHAGFILVSTSKGMRLAAVGADGNLTTGALIPIPTAALNPGYTSGGAGASLAFPACRNVVIGDDRFAYFAWQNYDLTSEGLGRLDLSTFTAPLTPAYASDLMVVVASGRDVKVRASSVTTWADPATGASNLVFAVAAAGVYVATAARVPTGTLDGGDISYGITDDKVASALDVSHEPLQGSHQALLSVNGGAFTSLGTHAEGGAEGPFPIPESRGERFEVRHTLNRNAALTAGPVLTRSTLSTYPVPRRPSEIFEVWLRLTTTEATSNGNTASRDPRVLLDDLVTLEETGTVIDFQLGDRTYRGLIEDHDFRSEGEPFGAWPEGSVGLTIRAI